MPTFRPNYPHIETNTLPNKSTDPLLLLHREHLNSPPLATISRRSSKSKPKSTFVQNQPHSLPESPHFSPKSVPHSAPKTFRQSNVCSFIVIKRVCIKKTHALGKRLELAPSTLVLCLLNRKFRGHK